MKYKYIVGLFIALSFSNAFAADEEIPANDYQQIYLAFTCRSVSDINAALENNQGFNHKDDTNIIRSSQTGLALRKAVIGLNAADLQAVVEKNHEFFKTSLGISLVYGWTLNQFKEPVTPYYIGDYFSFEKLFQGLASKMVDHNVATFLKSAFSFGLSAVEADRWAFYDHMLYLPYAIEQVRIKQYLGDDTCDDEAERATEIMSDNGDICKLIEPYTISINDVVRMSRRTKEEAQAEAKRAPGIAIHLQGDLGDPGHNWKDHGFVGLQKFTIQAPNLCSRINPITLEFFKSLPATTNGAYVFMGDSLNAHMATFRKAIHIEHDYTLISDLNYMNYEKKDAYPKTTSDKSFLNFLSMINLYKADLLKVDNKLDETITFLFDQNADEPLHEETTWYMPANYSKTRRDAIARLLPALKTILEPEEA